jgi:carbonic anhydrase
MLDLRDMMPSDESYYTYSGTLTTPPCTHAVQFVIFKEPMEASTAQISYFESYYADNARPVQPLHNRLILEKPTESL